jgi:hypothetical protein
VYERSLEHTSTRACRRAGLRAGPRVEVNHVPHANAAEQARADQADTRVIISAFLFRKIER